MAIGKFLMRDDAARQFGEQPLPSGGQGVRAERAGDGQIGQSPLQLHPVIRPCGADTP